MHDIFVRIPFLNSSAVQPLPAFCSSAIRPYPYEGTMEIASLKVLFWAVR